MLETYSDISSRAVKHKKQICNESESSTFDWSRLVDTMDIKQTENSFAVRQSMELRVAHT